MSSKIHKKFIVTGGPTREFIDPVRFISNPSTGKMGEAIASCAAKYFDEVIFIHGPISEQILNKDNYKSISVISTDDMLVQVLNEFEENSILVMAAAPADFVPYKTEKYKIKKSSCDELVLSLKKSPDILKEVNQKRIREQYSNCFVVGFAAETNDVEENAISKLKEKNLDMICANDVSESGSGFASDTNKIIIISKDASKINLNLEDKKVIADKIVNLIVDLI
jgi:phosphopantothenoylcysteine decarboxylase/phosphopantothenate--cysteine ligase